MELVFDLQKYEKDLARGEFRGYKVKSQEELEEGDCKALIKRDNHLIAKDAYYCKDIDFIGLRCLPCDEVIGFTQRDRLKMVRSITFFNTDDEPVLEVAIKGNDMKEIQKKAHKILLDSDDINHKYYSLNLQYLSMDWR